MDVNKSNAGSMWSMRWPTVLSVSTAFIATGTIFLHLVGAVSHRQYLKFWGIDANLFPKPVDWILINGYYSVFDRLLVTVRIISHNFQWLALIAFIIGVYVFILTSPFMTTNRERPVWISSQPAWRGRLFLRLSITTLLAVSVPLTLILLTACMVIPAALAESAGTSLAEKELVQYLKGCADSTIPCVELRRDEEKVAAGFLLDSSSSHVAIFDVQHQRSRIIAIEEIEIFSDLQARAFTEGRRNGE